MKPAKQTIIFDLDGTLIDSAPAIIDSFDRALKFCQIEPIIPLTSNVIGPPLLETLALLSGTHDPQALEKLSTAFKKHYDTAGYLETTIFEGVDAMLKHLLSLGFQLFIATNKRLTPTIKIIEHLGWVNYFTAIYALDSFSPALNSKADMLSEIIARHKLNIQSTIYIGDRNEDGESSEINKLKFYLAQWGYQSTPSKAWKTVESPNQLICALRAVADK